MPEITRSQLVVYGAIAVIVAILGARYLEGARASSPAGRAGAHSSADSADRTSTPGMDTAGPLLNFP